jgi:hypothetical protein
MLRKQTLAIVALMGMLFAIGYAEAAERGTSTRTPSARGVSATAVQTQSTGSLTLSKILRARFLRTWKMLADLEGAQTDPPVFGTNGLSDGPDPIDGSGQAGGGHNPPPSDKQDNNSGDTGGDDGSDDATSFDSN